jgi:nucleotide-binding universal stress UspA family protein
MKDFLVPIDGSECSLKAVRHAIALARGLDGEIHLVHGHEEPLLYGELAVYVPREKMEQMQRQHSEDILSRAEPLLQASGVRYTKGVLIGPIAEKIAEEAERLKCDAIVMGTHGMSAVGKLIMGSMATKVVHAARIPVMLVK